MGVDFTKKADEFIEMVRSAKITASSMVYAVYHCVDEHGDPLPPLRLALIEGGSTVKAPKDMAEWARQFADATTLDTLIGNINSIVRPSTQERFFVPRDALKIPMRCVGVELEILND